MLEVLFARFLAAATEHRTRESGLSSAPSASSRRPRAPHRSGLSRSVREVGGSARTLPRARPSARRQAGRSRARASRVGGLRSKSFSVRTRSPRASSFPQLEKLKAAADPNVVTSPQEESCTSGARGGNAKTATDTDTACLVLTDPQLKPPSPSASASSSTSAQKVEANSQVGTRAAESNSPPRSAAPPAKATAKATVRALPPPPDESLDSSHSRSSHTHANSDSGSSEVKVGVVTSNAALRQSAPGRGPGPVLPEAPSATTRTRRSESKRKDSAPKEQGRRHRGARAPFQYSNPAERLDANDGENTNSNLKVLVTSASTSASSKKETKRSPKVSQASSSRVSRVSTSSALSESNKCANPEPVVKETLENIFSGISDSDIKNQWVKINLRPPSSAASAEETRAKSKSATALDRSTSLHAEKKMPPKSAPPAKKPKPPPSEDKKGGAKRRSLLPFFDFDFRASAASDATAAADDEGTRRRRKDIIVGATIPSKNSSMDQTMLFSVESPRRSEPQSLTLEQYPRFIDLNCEFLSLHRRLDVITQRKYPLKRALQSQDLDPAARKSMQARHDRLKNEALETNNALFSVLMAIQEEFPKAKLSTVNEIDVPLNCPEVQLRKDFQRENFVICDIRFGPSSTSRWGYDFIRVCVKSAVEAELGIKGELLEVFVQKVLCAASRTDIGGHTYVQMLEYDMLDAAAEPPTDDLEEVPSTLISKGNTPPTIIEVSKERVLVTVFSHLYKTDPAVVTPYGDPEKTASPSAAGGGAAAVAAPPAKIQKSARRPSSESPLAAAVNPEGDGSGIGIGVGKARSSESQQFRDPLHNGAQFPWLKNFKRFMPVMTRTELWVKPMHADARREDVAAESDIGEEKTPFPASYSGPKLHPTVEGPSLDVSQSSSTTRGGGSGSSSGSGFASDAEQHCSSPASASAAAPANSATHSNSSGSSASPAASASSSKFSSSSPHVSCGHPGVHSSSASPDAAVAANAACGSLAPPQIPPMSREQIEEVIETRTSLMFSTVKNFQAQPPKFRSVNASGELLHANPDESAAAPRNTPLRFLPFQKKNKTVDLT